jgi:hypothetical protein
LLVPFVVTATAIDPNWVIHLLLVFLFLIFIWPIRTIYIYIYITVNLFFFIRSTLLASYFHRIICHLIKLYWIFLLCRTRAMNAVANTVHGLSFKTKCSRPKYSYSFELLGNNRMKSLFRNMALSYVLVASSNVSIFSVQILEIWQFYFHRLSSLPGKQPSTLTRGLV